MFLTCNELKSYNITAASLSSALFHKNISRLELSPAHYNKLWSMIRPLTKDRLKNTMLIGHLQLGRFLVIKALL